MTKESIESRLKSHREEITKLRDKREMLYQRTKVINKKLGFHRTAVSNLLKKLGIKE